jgi:SAM-dependent methyltransferase
VYDQPGSLYDLTYAHKDYAAESAWVTDAVRSRAPAARTLLDVACGTGAHLEHLRQDFDAQGLDLLDEFVATASSRTGVPVHQGDMVDFELGSRFDAVVCLFSAIGYVSDLDAAIASMARHLATDGVLVVEPWFTPDQWLDRHIHVLDNERDGQRLLRMTHSTVDGNRSIMEFHYLIGSVDGIEHRTEVHHMTLFTDDEYRAAFGAAGLDVELDQPGPSGRGAYVGTRS